VGEYPKCASCGNELGEGISRSSSSAGDVGSNPGSKEIIKSRILAFSLENCCERVIAFW